MPYLLLPALSDSPCLDVRLQAWIKDPDLPGKVFSTVTSLQKLAQCLSLSISHLLSLACSSFSLSLKPYKTYSKQNRIGEKAFK